MKRIIHTIIAVLFFYGMFNIITGFSDGGQVKDITRYRGDIHSQPITESDINLPDFYDVLGHHESRGRYNLANSAGYLGKYQFSLTTLKWIGFDTNRTDFLNDSAMQEKAVRKYVAVNRKLLAPYIKKYANTYYTYKGKRIYITESGILGGAHLGGHGSVKRFFDTNGKSNRADSNGTSILAYIETFSQTQI